MKWLIGLLLVIVAIVGGLIFTIFIMASILANDWKYKHEKK